MNIKSKFYRDQQARRNFRVYTQLETLPYYPPSAAHLCRPCKNTNVNLRPPQESKEAVTSSGINIFMKDVEMLLKTTKQEGLPIHLNHRFNRQVRQKGSQKCQNSSSPDFKLKPHDSGKKRFQRLQTEISDIHKAERAAPMHMHKPSDPFQESFTQNLDLNINSLKEKIQTIRAEENQSPFKPKPIKADLDVLEELIYKQKPFKSNKVPAEEQAQTFKLLKTKTQFDLPKNRKHLSMQAQRKFIQFNELISETPNSNSPSPKSFAKAKEPQSYVLKTSQFFQNFKDDEQRQVDPSSYLLSKQELELRKSNLQPSRLSRIKKRKNQLQKTISNNEISLASQIESQVANGTKDQVLTIIHTSLQNTYFKEIQKKLRAFLPKIRDLLIQLQSKLGKYKFFINLLSLLIRNQDIEQTIVQQIRLIFTQLKQNQHIHEDIQRLEIAFDSDFYEVSQIVCKLRKTLPDVKQIITLIVLFVLYEYLRHDNFLQFFINLILGIIRKEIDLDSQQQEDLLYLQSGINKLQLKQADGQKKTPIIQFNIQDIYSKDPLNIIRRSRVYSHPKKEAKRLNKVYHTVSTIDDIFKPNQFSLFKRIHVKNPAWKNIVWKHISEIYPNNQISLNGTFSRNLNRGLLNAQYLYKCLQLVSENEEFFDGLIEQNRQFLSVRLYHNGEPIKVEIDLYFPVVPKASGEQPVFVKPINQKKKIHIWPLAVQKALAKMYSTYQALQSSHNCFCDCYKDLTGQSFLQFSLQQPRIPFNFLKETQRRQQIVLIGKSEARVRLVDQITESFKFNIEDLSHVKKQFITKEEHFLGEVALKSLTHCFKSILFLLRFNHRAHMKINDSECQTALRSFKVHETSNIALDLTQVDKRFAGNRTSFAVIRLMLIRKQSNQVEFIEGVYGQRKTISFKCRVQPGLYYIYIDSKWPAKRGDLNLTLYSDKFHSLQVQDTQIILSLLNLMHTVELVEGHITLNRFINKRSGLIIEKITNGLKTSTQIHRNLAHIQKMDLQLLFSIKCDIKEELQAGDELVIVVRMLNKEFIDYDSGTATDKALITNQIVIDRMPGLMLFND